MEKTSVYLTKAERDRLSWLARETGRSQSDIIREAIAQYDPHGQSDRNFALFDSGRGPGGSIADVPEEELLEGFGE